MDFEKIETIANQIIKPLKNEIIFKNKSEEIIPEIEENGIILSYNNFDIYSYKYQLQDYEKKINRKHFIVYEEKKILNDEFTLVFWDVKLSKKKNQELIFKIINGMGLIVDKNQNWIFNFQIKPILNYDKKIKRIASLKHRITFITNQSIADNYPFPSLMHFSSLIKQFLNQYFNDQIITNLIFDSIPIIKRKNNGERLTKKELKYEINFTKLQTLRAKFWLKERVKDALSRTNEAIKHQQLLLDNQKKISSNEEEISNYFLNK